MTDDLGDPIQSFRNPYRYITTSGIVTLSVDRVQFKSKEGGAWGMGLNLFPRDVEIFC